MAEDENDPTSALRGTDLERPFPTSDSPAVPLRSGTVLAGRYEIGKTIGQGGMGLVVQAFDRTLGVEVAIKIVRAEYAGEREWSERLAREVKLARQIQHPNVCRVFDYAQADGRAFLIMELATGGTLRDELRAGTTAARPLAARIADARAIAAGLGAIHAAGIVHRDISPQNALRMSDGRLVLSDFGLATDSFDGTTSIRGGTVAYMAPEVARGGRASFSADIWALGAVIHETVFGQRLEWDPESGEMRSSVAGRRLTRTERSVLEICRACLAPNPARRPRSAGEIAARLSEAGLARSAGRWRRRRAATVTAAAFVVAAVVVGGQRVETARRRAAQAVGSARSRPSDDRSVRGSRTTGPTRRRSSPKCRTGSVAWSRFRIGTRFASSGVTRRTPRTSTPAPAGAPARRWSPTPMPRDVRTCPATASASSYAGHTSDDRAYAFVSAHPDGRDAVPEVPIAEPSRTSDPVWLPDGQSFLYDIDDKHVGVFSLETKHSEVVPTTLAPTFTSFHAVVGDRIFVDSLLQTGGADIGGFSFPHLNETVNFHLPVPMLDIQSPGGDTYYLVTPYDSRRWCRLSPPRTEVGSWEKSAASRLHYPLFSTDAPCSSARRRIGTLVRRAGGREVRARRRRRYQLGVELRRKDHCDSSEERNGEDSLARSRWHELVERWPTAYGVSEVLIRRPDDVLGSPRPDADASALRWHATAARYSRERPACCRFRRTTDVWRS